ncbi:MAG: methionine--tRNA ligase [Patescibacteria group bacterium]|nr:methionine--tRNA ligase [Patescibacteria group bacterium]
MEKFYVTTPIYYVNDRPHIGHAYTTVAADVFARYWRVKLGDDQVFFLTGTDEHGAKVAQAAETAGEDPQVFVDKIAQEYMRAWEKLNISHNYFIRTTDPRHTAVVQEVLQKLYDQGLIEKRQYKGMYCVGCEKYLTSTEIKDGKCELHPNAELVAQEEENYFLKLSELAPQVLQALENNDYRVLPKERREEILSRIKAGVEDISISRTGVSWGVKVPWDETHTVYVWVDALLNYFSATQIVKNKQEFWAPDLQLLAKDILWFHGLVWEAILIALKMKLPKDLFVHGFFSIDGQKMSKSLGNILEPMELAERYGVDGLRYLLLTAFAFGNDGDISVEKFDVKYNADLANGLGNLVSRVAKLAEDVDLSGVAKADDSLDARIEEALKNYRPDEALGVIWGEIGALDKRLDDDEPWKLVGEERTKKVLSYIPRLRWVAGAIRPFMPETAAKIEKVFAGDTVARPEALFQRL